MRWRSRAGEERHGGQEEEATEKVDKNQEKKKNKDLSAAETANDPQRASPWTSCPVE